MARRFKCIIGKSDYIFLLILIEIYFICNLKALMAIYFKCFNIFKKKKLIKSKLKICPVYVQN